MVQMEMLARIWLGKRQICRGFDSILIYVELQTLSAGKGKGFSQIFLFLPASLSAGSYALPGLKAVISLTLTEN